MTPPPTVMPYLLASPLLAASLPYVPFGSPIAIPVSTNICLWAGMVPSLSTWMSCPAAILEPFVGIIACSESFFILSRFDVVIFRWTNRIWIRSFLWQRETSKWSSFNIDCSRWVAPSSGQYSGRLLSPSGLPPRLSGWEMILKLKFANHYAHRMCRGFHTFVMRKYCRFWWSV